jgi:toxin CptA
MTAQNTQLASAAGEYRIARSLQLAAILAAGHCGVAALILLLDIAPAWQAAIVALLVASLVYELRMTALRLGANAVIALRISSDNAFSVQRRRGEWRECEVLGSTYVTAFLTVLNFRVSGARRVRSVVLMSDSMAADDFRRLRVWLRWRPQTKPD